MIRFIIYYILTFVGLFIKLMMVVELVFNIDNRHPHAYQALIDAEIEIGRARIYLYPPYSLL